MKALFFQIAGFSYFFFQLPPELKYIIFNLIIGCVSGICFVVAIQLLKENADLKRRLGRN